MLLGVARPCTRFFIQHKAITEKNEKIVFCYHTNNNWSKPQKTSREKLVILSKKKSDKNEARQRQNKN